MAQVPEPEYSRSTQGTRWMFTIFEDVETFNPVDWPDIKYLIYQIEMAPTTERMHVQGYVVFTATKRFAACKKIHSTANWRCCKGKHEQCKAYCSKSDTQIMHPIELGSDASMGAGNRSDLSAAKERIDAGCTVSDLYTYHYNVMVRYKKNILEYRDHVETVREKARIKATFPDGLMKDWQNDAVTDLVEQSDRQIQWIWSEDGNVGKTQLSKYILTHYEAFLCLNGKIADVAHAYKSEPYVVMDFTRDYEGMINYSLLESFKNGFIFSPKYESTVKLFKSCKVLVLANFAPDESRLSADRWQVKKVSIFTL